MTGKETVLVVGAGKMGSALARALATAGHDVSVWNRTDAKAQALGDVATPVSDLPSAASNASLIVVSLSDYKVCDEVVHTDEVGKSIGDATFVQISSGTPDDARRAEAWAERHSVAYLDAAILAYPSFVGTEYATVFYAGNQEAFDRHRETLKAFSHEPVFVDTAVGSAAALDCAILEAYYGGSLAFLHAAALCEAEGIPAARFFDYKASFVGLVDITADAAAPMIASGDFSGTQCSLDTHVGALWHIVRFSRAAGIDDGLPALIHRRFELAAEAGYNSDELPAAYATLAPDSWKPTAGK
jgi:3-hydroxyisobutyrate dehydrogenase-like beta-hydroxyacid dehydrogenase